MDVTELLKRHSLNLDNPIFSELIKNSGKADLSLLAPNCINPQQRGQYLIGEYFFALWKEIGQISSQLLSSAQWSYQTPEWFDHRHHFLFPERWLTDFVMESADNVLRALPVNGKLLNLCSGDGFYDYYFFRRRASEITGIEILDEPFKHAKRLHSASNIRYINGDIFDVPVKESYYDVVVIRGAIEHFSKSKQNEIFKIAYVALKDGGWFCGDTPQKRDIEDSKHLPTHEHEYDSEEDLCNSLSQVFHHVESMAYKSKDVPNFDSFTTLFWRCQK
jgi:ubiquinone/menaquinone biosynthesis C-methylase UbiE